MMMAKRSASSLARSPGEPPAALALPDGSTAELRGGALEIRDREGALMVKYQDGVAEISAPRGDLRLAAPAGRVVIQSGLDVSVEAGRDVIHHAGRRFEVFAAGPEGAPQVRVDHASTELRGEAVHVEARRARAVVAEAALVARAVAATAERMAVTAGAYELLAERMVVRTQNSFREIADLCEERAGRVRALVRGVYALTSRRTTMRSSDDTTIDGSRILLG
jgi:hypothetical protein